MGRFASQFAFATLLTSVIHAFPIEERSNNIHTVTITKPANNLTAGALLEKEKVRLNSFAQAASAGNVPGTNAEVSYYVTATIGSQDFTQLIVDTGSANTWVGAGTPYTPGSTATNTGGTVKVKYGSGSFSGKEYIDRVTIGGLTVQKQSIGSATKSTGFEGTDGILGLGPVILTKGTVSNANTVPTFLDNLKQQGTIGTQVLGVYFAPESGSDTSDQNGELTLGGTDSSKYSGSISYVPKSTTFPYSYYWGVGVSSILYNSKPLSPSPLNAIVDTGTTLIYIPTFAYNEFLLAAGGKTDKKTGLATFKNKPTGTVTFKIGGVNYPLTPSQYLIPSQQYSYWELPSGSYYSWIADGGPSANNVNFIIGQKFLENYYSVFDTTNSRVGFAPHAP